MTDIVDDIFIRVKNILGDDFKGEIAVKLENEETRIRQQWGGIVPYVSKKKECKKRRRQAIDELKKGIPVKEVAANTGVSKSHIYRLLKLR